MVYSGSGSEIGNIDGDWEGGRDIEV